MSGVLVGLDWSATFARAESCAPDVSRARLAQLFAAIEAGALEGAAARAERERGA